MILSLPDFRQSANLRENDEKQNALHFATYTFLKTDFSFHRNFNAVHGMIYTIGRILLLQLYDSGVYLCPNQKRD